MKARWVTASGLAVAFAAGIGLALYGLFIERARLQLVEYSLMIDKRGLPSDGLILLHLSDLHLRAGGRIQARKLAQLHRTIDSLPYDLALITGDLIHDAAGFPLALDLLGTLRPHLGAFSVWGNHDYCEYTLLGVDTRGAGAGGFPTRLRRLINALWQLMGQVLRNDSLRFPVRQHDLAAMGHELRARGVHPLLNSAVHVQARETDLWLAGIDDLMEGKPDLAAALANVPSGALLLLLAHNPDAWLDPLAERADLTLSGHTHGGQVQLPLVGAVHTQGTHLARRASAGWFSHSASRMFVTRGIGESLPLRIGARPQVALIHLFSP